MAKINFDAKQARKMADEVLKPKFDAQMQKVLERIEKRAAKGGKSMVIYLDKFCLSSVEVYDYLKARGFQIEDNPTYDRFIVEW